MASAKFCTQCGNPIEQDSAYCGNCGRATGSSSTVPPSSTATSSFLSYPALDPEPRKTGGVLGKVILGVLVLAGIIAILAAMISNSGRSTVGSTNSGTSVPVLPAAETQFISIVSAAQSESRQVENDMQRGGVKANRDSTLCRMMSSLLVSNWVGTVALVDSNSDGKGVFKVSIAPDVSVETWNNEISDMFNHTLMDPGSSVFNAASAMKPGQSVIFSGMFFPGSDGDCLNESSLTLQGKVESPDFIFRFSGVEPYSSSALARLNEEQSPNAEDSADNASQTTAAADQNPVLSASQAPSDSTGQEESPENPVQSQPSLNSATTNQATPEGVDIPTDVAVGMLISKVQPEYPPIAKAARVSGTVVLQASISKTGEITKLQVISGPAMLQQSALDAVKQWRYKPYLVNGEPVEVETTINVNFTLGE